MNILCLKCLFSTPLRTSAILRYKARPQRIIRFELQVYCVFACTEALIRQGYFIFIPVFVLQPGELRSLMGKPQVRWPPPHIYQFFANPSWTPRICISKDQSRRGRKPVCKGGGGNKTLNKLSLYNFNARPWGRMKGKNICSAKSDSSENLRISLWWSSFGFEILTLLWITRTSVSSKNAKLDKVTLVSAKALTIYTNF